MQRCAYKYQNQLNVYKCFHQEQYAQQCLCHRACFIHLNTFSTSCLYIRLTGSSSLPIAISSGEYDCTLLNETIKDRCILMKEDFGSLSSIDDIDCLVMIDFVFVTTLI